MSATAHPPTSVAALLDALHARGVELYRRGDGLRYRCPPGAFTADLRAAVAAQRVALLAELAPHPCARCGRHAYPVAGVTCYWCRRDPARAVRRSEDAA